MTNDEKELIRDLINQSSSKMQLLQKTIVEKDAEIEQLKAENEQLRKLGILGYEATVEFHDDIVSEPNEKEIKQAKIDVLKELKTRHDFAIKYMGYPWDISQQIDELIEEIKNEQKD